VFQARVAAEILRLFPSCPDRRAKKIALHEDTEYDRLLMTGVPRLEARERVRSAVDRVLNLWRAGHAVS
jgi:hypothetical protein